MKQSAAAHNELANLRETVESIWIAIILAFVLRAFVVEAFVIPTGSMAPRLMGQHQLARCHVCGMEFPIGTRGDGSTPAAGRRVMSQCPNCHQSLDADPAIYAGDRVLVLKYLYEFRQPQRWDVVVFKDPQSNELNYIKRLAGLPGEALRIIHGDVFVHPIEDVDHNGVRDEHDLLPSAPPGHMDLTTLTGWQLARKPHDVQEAMWQLTFDNDYRPNVSNAATPMWRAENAAAGWDLQEHQGRVFRFEGQGSEPLRFGQDMDELFQPSNAYNAQSSEMPITRGDMCTDLKLETTVLSESAAGTIRLTLSSFEHEFAAQFDFDGRVKLLHRTHHDQDWSAAQVWGQKELPAWKAGRAVHIALTHADWQATVWVNEQPVLETTDEQYHPDVPQLIQRVSRGSVPAPRVGITAADATCELWHTRVWRDVFYLCPTFYERPQGSAGRYALKYGLVESDSRMEPGWGTTANPIVLRAYRDRPELDEFFMLGDNSPASKDSRLWIDAAPSLRLTEKVEGSDVPLYRLGTVPRYNLIGRAFFVYWPAGGKLAGQDRLPYVPNVGKMRRIH